MPPSRAIAVLGMHRSGTSLLTCGLQAVGVYIGDNFLEARPDNPTGYWEDNPIVEINSRILNGFGRDWESLSLIEEHRWRDPALGPLSQEAVAYLKSNFLRYPLWGFKDPRTILLLPFWQSLFRSLEVDDNYIVVIRNPLSVASSLRRRQNMGALQSHLLWLLHLGPSLHRIAGKPFVVVDYDLLMADPREQLERVASCLNIQLNETHRAEIERFASDFLSPRLRHSLFSAKDFGSIPHVSPLTREAYHWLYRLATDKIQPGDPRFWSTWERIRSATEALISKVDNEKTETATQDSECRFNLSPRPCLPGTGVKLFVIIGTQRTGTNILRELLNTNDDVAMVAEVLTPCPPPGERIPGSVTDPGSDENPYQCLGTGPAKPRPGLNYRGHWGNFLRQLPTGRSPAPNVSAAEQLLDDYFNFLLDQIRRQWSGADKSRCRAIGVDIKYSHLEHLAPLNWDASSAPFLLDYFRSRGVTLIHATRKNVIHCAISAMLVSLTKSPHNYEGAVIDPHYHIDIEECLNYAQRIITDRDNFLKLTRDFAVIECCYEDLLGDLARSNQEGEISDGPGPLHNIAEALGVPFRFRDDGRLRKSINIPYHQLLSNWRDLVKAAERSEFSAFATTLGYELILHAGKPIPE